MALTLSNFIILGAVLAGVLNVIMYHVRRFRLYKMAAKFTGPRIVPIIGNAHYFVGNNADILKNIMALLSAYSSPFRVWLTNRLFIAVSDAEHFKVILCSPKAIEKDDLYKFIRPWLGTGLFTAPASKWRVHRKLIMPTFNAKILESFVEVFAIQSRTMVKKMEAVLCGEEFDIFHYVSLCTLDIICETAMGVRVDAQTGKNNCYVESSRRMLEIVFTRVFRIWLHPDAVFSRTKLGGDQRECLKYLHKITDDVIKKKRKEFTSRNSDVHKNEEVSHSHQSPRKAFLDLLIELSNNGTKFTDTELREEVDTMMLAGNDTTATINCFVMVMLAMHQDLQERAYRELCEIYGHDSSGKTLVTYEDLNRMEYMERIIKETMRLFPIAPIIVRRVTEDLDLGEHTIPKGSSVVLGILKVHRSENYWPDPLKFDPDRFLPEETAKRHPYCYIPFSGGPRNCLGIKYAMMAMKTVLATVLRHYIIKKDNIESIENIELKQDFMLKPVKPFMVRIERRNPEIIHFQ